MSRAESAMCCRSLGSSPVKDGSSAQAANTFSMDEGALAGALDLTGLAFIVGLIRLRVLCPQEA
jgi:hypothetical protein